MRKSCVPVFFAVDENYAPYLSTVLLSILDKTDSFIDVFVFDSGVSCESKKKISKTLIGYENISIKYIHVDLEKEFGHMPLFNKGHTLNVFSRYLIPRFTNYSKVLYLDVDIIVNVDILELYKQDLGNYHIGAVPEYTDKLDKHKDDLGLLKSHEYFNAGMLLIDADYFKREQMTEHLIDETLRIKPKYQDQDILNIVFQGNYKKLDYKYNVSWYMKEYNARRPSDLVDKALADPCIIHYSSFKPWNDIAVPYSSLFWKCARKSRFYSRILNNFQTQESAKKVMPIKSRAILGFQVFRLIKQGDSISRVYICKMPVLRIVKEPWLRKFRLFIWKFYVFTVTRPETID